MKKSKKIIALICMLFVTTCFMLPEFSYGATKKPTVEFAEKTVVREGPGTHFWAYIEHPIVGAKYSATVSDKDVAQVASGSIVPGGYARFFFYAKKTGKVTVRIKQTLNGNTTTIAKKQFVIKSKKFSAKKKKQEATFQKMLKKGSDPDPNGVSLEVVKVSDLKNTSKKVSLKVKFDHKVTAEEAKLGNKYSFTVLLDSKGDNYIFLFGKLKEGSQYCTVSASKKTDIYQPKKATKKGKKYYVSDWNRSKNKLKFFKVVF